MNYTPSDNRETLMYKYIIDKKNQKLDPYYKQPPYISKIFNRCSIGTKYQTKNQNIELTTIERTKIIDDPKNNNQFIKIITNNIFDHKMDCYKTPNIFRKKYRGYSSIF